MTISTSPQDARLLALAFLEQEGLNREFVENASLKPDDADILVSFCGSNTPKMILEIGTFVGVSSVVLGLCFPESKIVCIDPGLPTGLMNGLCVKQFDIPNYTRTMLEFVEAGLVNAGVRDRFQLHQGFFSCCFPHPDDRQQVIDYGINLDDYSTIGREVCEEYGPFDAIFLDADHRTEAVFQDLLLLHSYLTPEGAIVLHDMGEDFWGTQVREAVDRFLTEHPQFRLERQGELGKLRLIEN